MYLTATMEKAVIEVQGTKHMWQSQIEDVHVHYSVFRSPVSILYYFRPNLLHPGKFLI